MPPRFAYWTILIDNSPTAFRAGEADELLPTLAQLKRTNQNVVLKWFARGRLWDSRQEERDDFQRRKAIRSERRPKDWRPGGDHKDPRARFDKKKRRDPARPWQTKPIQGGKPWQKKPVEGAKPWRQKPIQGAKPWRRKPFQGAKPWEGKPPQRNSSRQEKSRTGHRPWHGKPKGRGPRKNDEPEDE